MYVVFIYDCFLLVFDLSSNANANYVLPATRVASLIRHAPIHRMDGIGTGRSGLQPAALQLHAAVLCRCCQRMETFGELEAAESTCLWHSDGWSEEVERAYLPPPRGQSEGVW